MNHLPQCQTSTFIMLPSSTRSSSTFSLWWESQHRLSAVRLVSGIHSSLCTVKDRHIENLAAFERRRWKHLAEKRRQRHSHKERLTVCHGAMLAMGSIVKSRAKSRAIGGEGLLKWPLCLLKSPVVMPCLSVAGRRQAEAAVAYLWTLLSCSVFHASSPAVKQ